MAFLGAFQQEEKPSFGTQLARGLGSGFGQGLSSSADFAQQMALEKQRKTNLAHETKQLEKIKMAEHALGTIGDMRKLLPFAGGWTSNTSNKLKSLYPGEVQQKRAELEALGRSLIPVVAAGVPVRNQREFEEYKKVITDPDSSGSQLTGALDGIQSLLERTLGDDEEKAEKTSKKKKQKFSAENPEHRKKAQQLHKTYNDKEKVRELLSREYEF